MINYSLNVNPIKENNEYETITSLNINILYFKCFDPEFISPTVKVVTNNHRSKRKIYERILGERCISCYFCITVF